VSQLELDRRLVERLERRGWLVRAAPGAGKCQSAKVFRGRAADGPEVGRVKRLGTRSAQQLEQIRARS
jgi:hypothetical protein